MPNKRKSNKKQLNAWVPDVLEQDIACLAREKGIPKSSMVEMILREQVAIYKAGKGKCTHGDESKHSH